MLEVRDFVITEEQADLLAPSFAVLVADGKCWKCAKPTRMSAILVPSYTEVDHEEEERAESYDAALLQYVAGLTRDISQQVLLLAPWLRYTRTESADFTYLANHCERCDAVQGDWFVQGVDGPLFPQTDEDLSQIKVMKASGAFHGCGSASVSSWMSEIGR